MGRNGPVVTWWSHEIRRGDPRGAARQGRVGYKSAYRCRDLGVPGVRLQARCTSPESTQHRGSFTLEGVERV